MLSTILTWIKTEETTEWGKYLSPDRLLFTPNVSTDTLEWVWNLFSNIIAIITADAWFEWYMYILSKGQCKRLRWRSMWIDP